MQFVLYLDEFLQLGQLPLGEVVYRLFFWYFGWLPIALAFIYGVSQLWLWYIEDKWSEKQSFILLAIDIPKNNEQSPKAVENMFAYLMGIQSNPNFVEEWWEGKYQLGFSFEIVGIDGYIQFLVRMPSAFRPNVETAIYSQYPDAEITEVADYTQGTPSTFPDPEYDIWSSEFVYTDPEQLPIKLSKDFYETQFGRPEVVFKDPLGNLMDLLSSFKSGEQFWLQIIINPVDNKWTKKSDEYIAAIMAKYKEVGLINMPLIEKRRLEAASLKKDQLQFKTKIRVVYFARKDVMDKAKVVNGFVGFMRQYGNNNLNSLKPNNKNFTSTAYFMAASRLNSRKNNIMQAYKGRSLSRGGTPMLMCTEELASLWHFPIEAVVKAPLLQRAAAKRVEAPMTLPMGNSEIDGEPIFDNSYEIKNNDSPIKSDKPVEDFGQFLEHQLKDESEPPPNLPFA